MRCITNALDCSASEQAQRRRSQASAKGEPRANIVLRSLALTSETHSKYKYEHSMV